MATMAIRQPFIGMSAGGCFEGEINLSMCSRWLGHLLGLYSVFFRRLLEIRQKSVGRLPYGPSSVEPHRLLQGYHDHNLCFGNNTRRLGIDEWRVTTAFDVWCFRQDYHGHPSFCFASDDRRFPGHQIHQIPGAKWAEQAAERRKTAVAPLTNYVTRTKGERTTITLFVRHYCSPVELRKWHPAVDVPMNDDSSKSSDNTIPTSLRDLNDLLCMGGQRGESSARACRPTRPMLSKLVSASRGGVLTLFKAVQWVRSEGIGSTGGSRTAFRSSGSEKASARVFVMPGIASATAFIPGTASKGFLPSLPGIIDIQLVIQTTCFPPSSMRRILMDLRHLDNAEREFGDSLERGHLVDASFPRIPHVLNRPTNVLLMHNYGDAQHAAFPPAPSAIGPLPLQVTTARPTVAHSITRDSINGLSRNNLKGDENLRMAWVTT
ncbi:hypothetical protein JOM56_005635 [Amanita muscaria]